MGRWSRARDITAAFALGALAGPIAGAVRRRWDADPHRHPAGSPTSGPSAHRTGAGAQDTTEPRLRLAPPLPGESREARAGVPAGPAGEERPAGAERAEASERPEQAERAVAADRQERAVGAGEDPLRRLRRGHRES